MFIRKRYELNWIGCRFRDGWREWFSRGFRFNGGGYMYGASPYQYWRIGPVMIKKYM